MNAIILNFTGVKVFELGTIDYSEIKSLMKQNLPDANSLEATLPKEIEKTKFREIAKMLQEGCFYMEKPILIKQSPELTYVANITRAGSSKDRLSMIEQLVTKYATKPSLTLHPFDSTLLASKLKAIDNAIDEANAILKNYIDTKNATVISVASHVATSETVRDGEGRRKNS